MMVWLMTHSYPFPALSVAKRAADWGTGQPAFDWPLLGKLPAVVLVTVMMAASSVAWSGQVVLGTSSLQTVRCALVAGSVWVAPHFARQVGLVVGGVAGQQPQLQPELQMPAGIQSGHHSFD